MKIPSWLGKLVGKEEAEAQPGLLSGAQEKMAKAFFYRKWKDPAFLKQLKVLQAHMAKDGVNMTDRASVEAWLRKNEARLKAGELQDIPDEGPKQATFVKTTPDVGRNDPCTCGSGKKYKKCCGAKAQ